MIVKKLISNKTKLYHLKSEDIIRSIHFNSLISITDFFILKGEGVTRNRYIDLVNDYYALIFENKGKFNKKSSLDNYKRYILPCGLYLERKQFFISSHSLWRCIIFGMILDFVLYLTISKSIFLPVFTFLLLIYGLKKRADAKTKNKYFNYRY